MGISENKMHDKPRFPHFVFRALFLSSWSGTNSIFQFAFSFESFSILSDFKIDLSLIVYLLPYSMLDSNYFVNDFISR
jgi:hypothetical protein